MPIWPGEAVVLAKQKNGVPPPFEWALFILLPETELVNKLKIPEIQEYVSVFDLGEIHDEYAKVRERVFFLIIALALRWA